MKIKAIILAAVMFLGSSSAYAASVLSYEEQSGLYLKVLDEVFEKYVIDIDYDEVRAGLDPSYINDERYKDRFPTISFSETADGKVWEEPMAYLDWHAELFNSYNMERKAVTVLLDGNAVEINAVIFNSRTLVPAKLFEKVGCEVTFDPEYYSAEISKEGTVLDLYPHVLALRKNKAEGMCVPLNACPRYIDGEVYVPIRDVAFEFDISVGWDDSTKTVMLESKK